MTTIILNERIMNRARPLSIAATIAALVVLLATFQAAADDDLFLVAAKATPESADDLRVLEKAASAVAEKALPCTVGIQVGNNFGSGVVVSEDGLVLTAAHVTARPGRRATIRFSDGTTVAGRTLGMNIEADGALIQITEERKWPFAKLVSLDDYPRPGDWCIATGHPGGFDENRTPPIRLGRVIDVNQYILRTDCTINSGDSGGPLFDIEGRVIGIHSRISEENTVNLHGPVLEFLESWKQMKAGEIYPKAPASRFLTKLDKDGDGKITRDEQPDDTHRGVYDRLVEKYGLDADAAHSIDDLISKFQWRETEASLEIRPYEPSSRPGHSLPQERFVRGKAIRAAFKPLLGEVSKSIVEVQCDGKRVCLGTIVPQGILTKASQLSGEIICKLHDGTTLSTKIVHTDVPHDLALLAVEKEDLSPIEWSESTPALGNWLVTAGPKSRATSIGVMSVAGRKIEGVTPVLGVAIADENSTRVGAVAKESGADKAGMKPFDLITHVFETEVKTLDELKGELSKFHAGDIVKTKVLRAGEELQLDVRLGMRDDVFKDDPRFGSGQLNGPLNLRRDNFPDVIQHDTVLEPNQVGGPLLDLNGKVVGINIARADRIASYAIPCRAIQDVLEKFEGDEEAEKDSE